MSIDVTFSFYFDVFMTYLCVWTGRILLVGKERVGEEERRVKESEGFMSWIERKRMRERAGIRCTERGRGRPGRDLSVKVKVHKYTCFSRRVFDNRKWNRTNVVCLSLSLSLYVLQFNSTCLL